MNKHRVPQSQVGSYIRNLIGKKCSLQICYIDLKYKLIIYSTSDFGKDCVLNGARILCLMILEPIPIQCSSIWGFEKELNSK